jgi:hypothetical protein
LSQNATLPGCQRNRTVYSVRVASSHSASRRWELSRGPSPRRFLALRVNPGLTYNARSSVSGCTRTTGWKVRSGLRVITSVLADTYRGPWLYATALRVGKSAKFYVPISLLRGFDLAVMRAGRLWWQARLFTPKSGRR